MEILDVVDETGAPTGETVERTEAHREGVRHRTSHVWIARNRNGRIQLLLQKRCMQKDSFPGCYDISSAGHIPAGEEYIPSAIRELKEELNVTVQESDLIYCGQVHKDDGISISSIAFEISQKTDVEVGPFSEGITTKDLEENQNTILRSLRKKAHGILLNFVSAEDFDFQSDLPKYKNGMYEEEVIKISGGTSGRLVLQFS